MLVRDQSALAAARAGSVGRDGGPVVGPGAVLPLAFVYHGLDSEYVPRRDDALRLVLGVVRHVGRRVEQLANAVPAVGAHHAMPRLRGVLGDHLAQVAIHGARSHLVQRRRQTAEGALDERPARLVEDGLAVAGSAQTYATGRLALMEPGDATAGTPSPLQRLQSGDYRRLALASPDLAPYGAAAHQVCWSTSTIGEILFDVVPASCLFVQNISNISIIINN